MPRRVLIHRDAMLDQTGYMPRAIPGENPKAFEHRKAQAAQRAAQQFGLNKYTVPGTRALRYDQSEVQRKAKATALAA